MPNINTKNRILCLFEGGYDAYRKVKKEEYCQLYFAVQSDIEKGDAKWNAAVREFLMYGTMAFDRFVDLRPQYVNEDLYDMFCKFLNVFQKMEGNFTGHSYFLHLDRVKALASLSLKLQKGAL